MRNAFIEIADQLEADMAAGRLRPGDRLPPQREFAFKRKIAVFLAMVQLASIRLWLRANESTA